MLASGGTGEGASGIGALLLLNLFRDRLGVNGDGVTKPGGNGAKKPAID